jgi:hypothetical protein
VEQDNANDLLLGAINVRGRENICAEILYDMEFESKFTNVIGRNIKERFEIANPRKLQRFYWNRSRIC